MKQLTSRRLRGSTSPFHICAMISCYHRCFCHFKWAVVSHREFYQNEAIGSTGSSHIVTITSALVNLSKIMLPLECKNIPKSVILSAEKKVQYNHISSRKSIRSGVPQGSILGPLMFLLYINDLPEYLRFTTPGLYADDTQIYASSDNYDELVNFLNSDLENISRWLSDNKLQHHATKTKLMFIGSPYNIRNKIGDKSVIFRNTSLLRYRSFKCLGVEIDEHLSWEVHVNAICKKISAGIGVLKRTKPFVHETLHTIYKALIQPYFDYCSPLWDNC